MTRTARVGRRGVRHRLQAAGWRTVCGYIAQFDLRHDDDAVDCKLCLDTLNGTPS